jgi:hypothetical protein
MKRFFDALSPWLCLKTLFLFGTPVLFSSAADAQQPRDTLQALLRSHAEMVRATRAAPLWPGFRPDTIPVAFVLPARGQFLVGWRGDLPTGFEPGPAPGTGWRAFDARTAASTSIDIAGRSVAQVSVQRLDMNALAGVAAHEAFHAFAFQADRMNSRFGERENSFLVASYPVLDSENDALMTLEGRLLNAALSAALLEDARARAREFVAVRARRHGLLGPDLANFENQAEINEGLAEYMLIATTNVLANRPFSAASPALLQELQDVAADPVRSFRLRYYKLGPAQLFLLDKLDPNWKRTFLSEKSTFADLIAEASGARAVENNARATAEQRADVGALRKASEARIRQLQSFRRAQIDSLLARPGTMLVIDVSGLPNRDVNWCGIDPQNLLQAAERVLLHTRYLNACSGRSLSAEFATPVVQDRNVAELRAVVEGELRITSAGAPVTVSSEPVELNDVSIEAPTFNARFTRVVLRRAGNTLHIQPRI